MVGLLQNWLLQFIYRKWNRPVSQQLHETDVQLFFIHHYKTDCISFIYMKWNRPVSQQLGETRTIKLLPPYVCIPHLLGSFITKLKSTVTIKDFFWKMPINPYHLLLVSWFEIDIMKLSGFTCNRITVSVTWNETDQFHSNQVPEKKIETYILFDHNAPLQNLPVSFHSWNTWMKQLSFTQHENFFWKMHIDLFHF